MSRPSGRKQAQGDDLQFRRGAILQLKTTERFTRQQVADLVPKLAALGLRPTFSHIGSNAGTPEFEQLAAFVERNWPKDGSSFIGKEHMWYALHLRQHQGKSDRIIKNLADRALDFVRRPVLVDTDAAPSYYPVTMEIDPRDHGMPSQTRDNTSIEPFPNNAFARAIMGQGYRQGTPIHMVEVAGFVGFSEPLAAVGDVKFHNVGTKTIDAVHVIADVFRPYAVMEGLESSQILAAN